MQVEKQPEPKKLLKSLFEQRINKIFCDVQLQLQDTIIWGHACVLASCSSYFMKCLQPSCVEESNSENHWCSKKPLIIDLVKVMSDSECHCSICVSKIIDFMYLREIVVIKGHFKHFCKIANYLKVFDLSPLCQKYFAEINSPASIKSEHSIEQVGKNTSKIDCNDKITEAECVQKELSENRVSSNLSENQTEVSFTNEIHKLLTNEVEITTSNNDVTNEIKFTKKCAENRTKVSDEAKLNKIELSVPSNSEWPNNKTELEVVKSNYESEVENKQKCKYLCCKSDTNTSSATGTKPVKRRKLTCELCNHSSVSLQKIIQHIESTNHFGTLCPICNRQIKSVNDLKEHLKDHIDPKPYICYICRKRNRHWEYHKLHLRTHCKNKEFECKVCKKSFKRHYSLKAHLTTHDKKYLCKTCDYLTSDLKMYKSHLIQHSEENINNYFPEIVSDDKMRSVLNNELKKHIIEKDFHCQICGEGFTQKKNLTRHIQLKHFSVTEYRCSKCTYTTKRTDLLRHHMKKYHDCSPTEVDVKKWKDKKKPPKKVQKPEDALKGSNNICGVLIPVELVSTSDKSTISAFAVKTCVNKEVENKEIAYCIKSNIVKNKNNNSSSKIITNQTRLCEPQQQKSDQVNSNESKLSIVDINTDFLTVLPNIPESKIDLCDEKINNLNSLSTINECATLGLNIPRTCEKEVNDLVVKFSADIQNCFNNNTDLTETFNEVYAGSQELKSLHLPIDKECNGSIKGTENKFLGSNENIWLNETTGELLSGNNFMSLHIIDTGCTVDPNEQSNTAAPCNSSLDFSDPFQRLILNESVGGISVFDLGDDADDWQSNPQTPQTNLVELDDPENLFNWNCLDNSFCSTWVLNETTGELNLASFSIQPLKNSDELKLDENTGTFSSIDDDNTALFLNEGTGDLSVIYLNSRPNTHDCNSPLTLFNEHLSQENIETLSEHSNDEDDDLLNEEFRMASASFMAHEENETFLNELTGEFDNANLNTYQSGLQPNQITGNESMYLNEETGEISWNVLDSNLFTNTDNLRCSFDDSLNYDEYEPFTTEMGDFSSQFCLENSISNDYYTVDENCDTLLNECTGELVKKS